MTEKEKRFTLWYDEMDGSDFPLVGKKNANLGEMIKAGIPVSPGFAITIYANDEIPGRYRNKGGTGEAIDRTGAGNVRKRKGGE